MQENQQRESKRSKQKIRLYDQQIASKATNLTKKKDSLVYHKIAVIQLNSKSKWTIKFVEAYKHDEIATRNLKISNKEYNKDENELLLFEKLLYVSKNLRKKVIQSHHEKSLQDHTDAAKTLEKIQRNYYFSNMRKQVEELTKECDLCQRNKYERHKSYEYLHSLKSSKKSRQFISINFITKLSFSYHFEKARIQKLSSKYSRKLSLQTKKYSKKWYQTKINYSLRNIEIHKQKN